MRVPSTADSPAEQPLRKGDRTKAAILDAAREVFHRRGYAGASVRAIAAAAGIDPALVIRYFGSKQALFAAAVHVDLAMPDLAAVTPSDRGRVLVEHFVRLWEGGPGNDVLVMLLRSAATHDDAAARMREVFRTQVVAAIDQVTEESTAARRAGLISSQLLGVALARYVLRLPPLMEPTPAQLVADLAPTIQRYLEAPLPA